MHKELIRTQRMQEQLLASLDAHGGAKHSSPRMQQKMQKYLARTSEFGLAHAVDGSTAPMSAEEPFLGRVGTGTGPVVDTEEDALVDF